MLKTFTNISGPADKKDMLQLFAMINYKRAELDGKDNLNLSTCNASLTNALPKGEQKDVFISDLAIG